jgi:hypothetical protein
MIKSQKWKWKKKDEIMLDPEEAPIIPLMIQLPTLKDPLNDALRETLRSDFYRFDSRQIDEFRDLVEKGKLRLVIIMDSYDELKSDFIKRNLYHSNHLENWRNSDFMEQAYPKVIITTRNEIFSSDDGYESWFTSKDDSKL